MSKLILLLNGWLRRHGGKILFIVLLGLYIRAVRDTKELNNTLDNYQVKSDTTFKYLLNRYAQGKPLAESLRAIAAVEDPSRADILDPLLADAGRKELEWQNTLIHLIHHCDTGPVLQELGMGIGDSLFYSSVPLQKELQWVVFSNSIDSHLYNTRKGYNNPPDKWEAHRSQLRQLADELESLDTLLEAKKEQMNHLGELTASDPKWKRRVLTGMEPILKRLQQSEGGA